MAKSRKDINKEEMFSKIMPSGTPKSPGTTRQRSQRPFNPAEQQINAARQNAQVNRVEATEEEKQLDEYVDKLSARKKIADKDPVAMADELISKAADSGKAEEVKEDKNSTVKAVSTVMVNLRERMVMDKLDEAMEKFKCCKCFFCKQDVTTIALNNLKPKYVVTLKEDIDTIIQNEDFSEVTQAIMKAILEVKTHPRH